MKKTNNVREVALETLLTIEKNQAYSHLLLNSMIKKNHVKEIDIPLLTEMVYGTLQRKDTIDFYLAPFLKNAKKICMLIEKFDYEMSVISEYHFEK